MRQLTVAHAHCDLYCGVYDPAQAKIEAMSVLKIAEKYATSDDEVFKARAIALKEERAEDVKHHLMVLWADFFTAEHREQFPNLDDLFWRAIHQAGDAKKSVDPEDGRKLIALIDEIGGIFWQTEKAKGMGVYPPA
ncbi:MAG TPA: superoxide dismutase, Ni [Acidimicrobiia bacterium]|jgi:nickel superoxide dismutase|nr:superoxide dismutase, Ni [Acidimicrobiia bacterium]